MYDGSGVPVVTFPPVNVIIAVSGFQGDLAVMRHILTGEEIVGVRISTGLYQFSISTNPEYQLMDLFKNGIINGFITLSAASMGIAIRPAEDGSFEN
jgi:hypothetical protein